MHSPFWASPLRVVTKSSEKLIIAQKLANSKLVRSTCGKSQYIQ